MSNTFGNVLRITTFGESHGVAIGAVIDGLESNFIVSEERIKKDLNERRPGLFGTTSRIEDDDFEILSGIFNGKTLGTPIAIIIRNNKQNSSDYYKLKDEYRPGHADYTYQMRYGIRDYRGGGRASGRETVSRVAAGSIVMQVLEQKGITIKSEIVSIAGFTDKETQNKALREAYENNDSVGGKIKCTVSGLKPGCGDPVFDKLDATISHAVMSIGAVKGIEFGSGFGCEKLLGSVNNNSVNAGGILGGISDGNDIVFQVAVKPTPSVNISGRHDTCIALRIGPVIKAMTAFAVLDSIYSYQATLSQDCFSPYFCRQD